MRACAEALGDRKQPPTDEQCIRAAGYLSQARALYALGIEGSAAALGKIDKAIRCYRDARGNLWVASEMTLGSSTRRTEADGGVCNGTGLGLEHRTP